MSDLLPCPFCGEFAEFGQIADDCMPPHPDQGGHFIQCTNNACGSSTNLRFPCGDDPDPLLAEQWNRRADRGFQRGIEAAIEYHETEADDIRTWGQLEPSSYDAIGFHEEAIAGLQHLVPGGKDIVKRLSAAEGLLRRIVGEIGFADTDALVRRIDGYFLSSK